MPNKTAIENAGQQEISCVKCGNPFVADLMGFETTCPMCKPRRAVGVSLPEKAGGATTVADGDEGVFEALPPQHLPNASYHLLNKVTVMTPEGQVTVTSPKSVADVEAKFTIPTVDGKISGIQFPSEDIKMSKEMIKVNCAHCDVEYMTDRFHVEHHCERCKEPFLLRQSVLLGGVPYIAVGGITSHSPLLAKVFTRAQVETFEAMSGSKTVSISPLHDAVTLDEVNAAIHNLEQMRQYLEEHNNAKQ